MQKSHELIFNPFAFKVWLIWPYYDKFMTAHISLLLQPAALACNGKGRDSNFDMSLLTLVLERSTLRFHWWKFVHVIKKCRALLILIMFKVLFWVLKGFDHGCSSRKRQSFRFTCSHAASGWGNSYPRTSIGESSSYMPYTRWVTKIAGSSDLEFQWHKNQDIKKFGISYRY